MLRRSLQLAYVAAGCLDAYWQTGHDAEEWITGSLLVREAGGAVTDLAGAPFVLGGDGQLAGGATLHAALLSIIHPGSAEARGA